MTELYPWQQQALQEYKQNDSLIVQACTGSGKTILALEIIKDIIKTDPNARILIIVPKIVILEQVWLKELYNHGYGPHQIGIYYNKAKEYSKIVLTTTVSCSRLNLQVFTHLIVDELHNMMTDRLLQILKQPWKKKVGLSATIYRADLKHNKIIKLFNASIINYDIKQATKDDIISKLEYHDIPVPFDDVALHAKYVEVDNELKRANAQLMQQRYSGSVSPGLKARCYQLLNERNDIIYNYPAKLEQVKKIVQQNQNKKILIFNQRNDVSQKLYWMLLDVCKRPVIINSSIPQNKQRKNMIAFKEGHANVLLASMSLDEGMNVPTIDIGIILSGNATPRQLVQRAGRVLRKAQGKEAAHIYQVYLKDSAEEKQARLKADTFRGIIQS